MSVKLKITLFIAILIVVSLGITIYYLSFEKYKPALEKEVVSRLTVQLNYINKIMKPIITEGWKENNTILLNAIAEMFKTNPELLYFTITRKGKKSKYYTYSVYRRNIITVKEEKEPEPYEVYTIENINRIKGGRWIVKLKEDRKIINASLNYYSDLKNDFVTNSRIVSSFYSNLNVLKSSNVNLLKQIYLTKKKRMSRKEKSKLISKAYKSLNLNLRTYSRIRKKMKKFVNQHTDFLDKADEIFSYINEKKHINILRLTTLKEYNMELTDLLTENKKIRGSLISIVNKKNREVSKILNYLKNLKRAYTGFLNKDIKKFEYIKEVKILFPVGKTKDKDLFKKISLMKLYKPIKYFNVTKGYFEIGVSEDEILTKIKPIINSGVKSSLYIILIGLLAGLLIALYIIFPIKKLEKGVEEIKKDTKYRIKIKRKDEFGKFAETFNDLATQLTEELKKYEKLYQEATEDGLTKLMVRKYYMETLKSELENAKKEKRPTSLFMTDIDHFKKFNDTYGHQTGDIVLAEVAKVLRKNLRTNRVRNDVAGRYGGEEFCVLLPDTKKEEALKAAERIRKEIEDMVVKSTDGKDLKVTISIGVATQDDSDIEPEKLIERADNALYNSKETGRNKVSYG